MSDCPQCGDPGFGSLAGTFGGCSCKKPPKVDAYQEWLKNHPCDTETIWYIQNCLGTLFGFEHPMAQSAKESWEESRESPEKKEESIHGCMAPYETCRNPDCPRDCCRWKNAKKQGTDIVKEMTRKCKCGYKPQHKLLKDGEPIRNGQHHVCKEMTKCRYGNSKGISCLDRTCPRDGNPGPRDYYLKSEIDGMFQGLIGDIEQEQKEWRKDLLDCLDEMSKSFPSDWEWKKNEDYIKDLRKQYL